MGAAAPRKEIVTSADGTPIACFVSGAGPSLVLVHGAGSGHEAWDSVVPLLAPRLRMCAYDRRGRGESGDTQPYAVEREVEDLHAVVGHAGAPVSLYGHSSGAILALMAAAAGAPLERLILYEPPLFFELPPDLPERLAAVAAAGDRDGAVATWAREGSGRSEAEIDLMRASPRWGRWLAVAHTLAYDTRIARDYVFVRDRLASLRLPTLFLLGGESPARMASATNELARAITGSRVAVLPGQGHDAHQRAPALLAREIAAFLSER